MNKRSKSSKSSLGTHLTAFLILLRFILNDINQNLLNKNEDFAPSTNSIILANALQLPEEIQLGGLFEKGEEHLALAFRLAVARVNIEKKILPKTRLTTAVEILDKSDSFAASRKVCSILQNSLFGIFGPQSSKSSNYARSVCKALQLPHFETRWDSSLVQPTDYSVNLAPLPSTLGRALSDLVVKKNWKTFAILYSEDSSMILIQEILKHPKMHSKHIIVRKAREIQINYLPRSDPRSSQRLVSSQTSSQTKPSFKEILKELSKLNVKNMIIDVPRDQVLTVLSHAKDVNMLRVYNSYIFTTLDLHTVDLEQFYQTGTNISAFSIIDAKQLQINGHILRQWENAQSILGDDLRVEDKTLHEMYENNTAHLDGSTLVQPSDGSLGISIPRNMTTEAAFLYDAVELMARSLAFTSQAVATSLVPKSDLNGASKFPLTANCARKSDDSDEQMTPWSLGRQIKHHMQFAKFKGLTGDMNLHERGYRSDFNLQLYDLTRDGLRSVAEWTSTGGLSYIGNYSIVMTENYKELLKNRTLTIVTLENRPYVMKVQGWENKTGNDRWEGYCIDLIRELSEIGNFKYVIRVLEGDAPPHGNKNEKGEWNGLIRELIDGKADISVADLTITYERESVVDFTMPFMSLGIGILVKKPTKASPKLFEFMLPLAPEVWIYLITAFVGVTLFLFMVARFSPYEWQNPHPCEQEAEVLLSDFSMKNTLWFTIGCLMQQGCDIMPGALSTRVVAASWWFFILILVSSYTANLAAFLTVERMDNPIQSADDLAKQTKVLYGCLKSGSTRAFFQKSNYTTYARMWSFMESRRAETLLESNSKGVERVKKGDFAFLMESTTIEYTVERNCDLSQVGSLLDQKGYGIATQQDSPYRAVLSEAILTLQEKGALHRLKDRWWKEKKEGNTSCEVKEQQKSSGTASELGLDHVGGVFVVLGAGALLAIIICLLEFYWKHIKTPRGQRENMLKELMREFKAIFLSGNKRPIRSSLR